MGEVAKVVLRGDEQRTLGNCTSSALVQLLTELDERIVSRLHITEFLDQRWQKSPEQAPSLVAMAANFNKTSCWVAHCVLSQPTSKERALHPAEPLSPSE